MKKLIAFLLMTAISLCLVACSKPPIPHKTNTATYPTENNKAPCFIAKVIDVSHGTCLIRPVEGTTERTMVDKITIQLSNDVHVKIGDYVKIVYNGKISASYPAQIQDAQVSIYTDEILDLPWLSTICSYTEEQLAQEVVGITRKQLREIWGTPYGVMLHSDADVWYVGTTREATLEVHYDKETQRATQVTFGLSEERMQPLCYTYLGKTHSGDSFYLTLYTDGSFIYYEGKDEIYLGAGKWQMNENGILCLRDSEVENSGSIYSRINYFQMVGNHLKWIAEGSDGFESMEMKDKAIFPAVY